MYSHWEKEGVSGTEDGNEREKSRSNCRKGPTLILKSKRYLFANFLLTW